MSMKSWTEYGYGFSLFNDTNMNKVKSFILQNLKTTDSDVIDNIRNAEDEYEIEENLDQPVSWWIAGMVNEREGLSIMKGYQSDGDTGQEAMLGIEPCYPWSVTEKDMITKEDADRILTKYADILGITDAPNYFEAEYFG